MSPALTGAVTRKDIFVTKSKEKKQKTTKVEWFHNSDLAAFFFFSAKYEIIELPVVLLLDSALYNALFLSKSLT